MWRFLGDAAIKKKKPFSESIRIRIKLRVFWDCFAIKSVFAIFINTFGDLRMIVSLL